MPAIENLSPQKASEPLFANYGKHSPLLRLAFFFVSREWRGHSIALSRST